MLFKLNVFVAACCILLLTNCRYTFSGYEIDAESVSVAYFQNQAPIQTADLSQIFTNKLEDKLIRETPLRMVKDNGELTFGGAITNYSVRALSVSGTETTEQSELSLSVQVEYTNTDEPEKNFSQTFTAAQNFDANVDLTTVEDDLLDTITNQIVDEIFNRAFINW